MVFGIFRGAPGSKEIKGVEQNRFAVGSLTFQVGDESYGRIEKDFYNRQEQKLRLDAIFPSPSEIQPFNHEETVYKVKLLYNGQLGLGLPGGGQTEIYLDKEQADFLINPSLGNQSEAIGQNLIILNLVDDVENGRVVSAEAKKILDKSGAMLEEMKNDMEGLGIKPEEEPGDRAA